MSFWGKLSSLLHISPRMQNDKTQSDPGEIDYGERIKPPNSIFGKAAGDRSVNPRDGSNPANPFSPSKKDKW